MAEVFGANVICMKYLFAGVLIWGLVSAPAPAETNAQGAVDAPAAAEIPAAPATPYVAPTVVPLQIKDFLGTWKVKDGRENVFMITLKDDGTAFSKWEDPALADRAETGQWSLRKGEALITWPNGWREIISFDGTSYSKRAYGSTHKLDGRPSNRGSAEKIAATP